MFNIGWVYVLVQFSCIIYLIRILPIFKISLATYMQLLPIFMGLWAIYESRKGRFGILPQVVPGSQLIMTGPYKWIRHPMYSCILFFFLIGIIDHFSLEGLLIYNLLLIDIILKLNYEEKLLLRHYGNYAKYMKSTFRLIPFVY